MDYPEGAWQQAPCFFLDNRLARMLPLRLLLWLLEEQPHHPAPTGRGCSPGFIYMRPIVPRARWEIINTPSCHEHGGQRCAGASPDGKRVPRNGGSLFLRLRGENEK